MPAQLFPNRNGTTLIKKFEGIFTHVPGTQHFDALVGYFRAPGYFKVRAFLDNTPEVRNYENEISKAMEVVCKLKLFFADET